MIDSAVSNHWEGDNSLTVVTLKRYEEVYVDIIAGKRGRRAAIIQRLYVDPHVVRASAKTLRQHQLSVFR